MNKYKIIALILFVLLVLSVTFSIQYFKQSNQTIYSLSGEPVTSSEALSELKMEYDVKITEAEMEEKLNYYDIDDYAFLSLNEAKSKLSSLEEFKGLDNDYLCKMAQKAVRRSKCVTKRKYMKQIVKKSKYGNFKLGKDGEIELKAPSIDKFKNEVSRINTLITVLHEERLRLCNIKDYCDKNYLLFACLGKDAPKEAKAVYTECLKIYDDNLDLGIINILREMGAKINLFEKGQISDEQVKTVMNSQMDSFEKENNKSDDVDESPKDSLKGKD